MSWTKWTESYSKEDEQAFRNAARINSHFGLSYSSVFSLALDYRGEANIHQGGRNGRTNYFANLLTYRYIKTHWEDAWIWDERYRFAGEPKNAEMLTAQREFIRLFGEGPANEICRLARKAGLEPGEKTAGRPDLAVYFPTGDVKWRFIEMKRSAKNDKVNERQAEWLNLFASHLGPEAAIEFEWQPAYDQAAYSITC